LSSQPLSSQILSLLGYGLVKFLEKTCRLDHSSPPNGELYILAAWHEHILPLVLSQRGKSFCTIVSQAEGGFLIGEICKRYGYFPIYGSQDKGRDKGGFRALVQLRQQLRIQPGAITVDGSVGPRHVVKPGIIELARITQIPIVPFGVYLSNTWELKTWDRLKIPKPWSQIWTQEGSPILIPKETPQEEYPRYQELIKNEIFKEMENAKNRR
jgi:lysophospholipid acyltransferase (LPLAT)-like uncharacterized protein